MNRYIKLWTEENYNCYDLEPVLANYWIFSRRNWGIGIDEGMIFCKDFSSDFYLTEEGLDKESKRWFGFFMNENKVGTLLKSIDKASKSMIDGIKILVKKNLSRPNNSELWGMFGGYDEKIGALMNCYIATQPHRTARFEKEIISFLEKRKVVDKESVFSLLTASDRRLELNKASKDFYKKNFSEMISKEDSRIDKKMINKFQYKEIRQKVPGKAKELSNLNPNARIRKMVDVLSRLGHERFKMRLIWMVALYYRELFIMEFKRRFMISKKELRLYDIGELDYFVQTGEKISPDIINMRKQGFMKQLKDGEIITYEGEVANKMLLRLAGDDWDTTEIIGVVASKGYAKGKVIVLSYKSSQDHAKKINAMKEGDIIITEMTRPNLITACKKAGAIVTDEGGITCHAAIISRELKKPCVIGTRVATSQLKDGDIVEVDAEKGIVRKVYEK